MRNDSNLFGRIDKITLILYYFLTLFGWINLFATVNAGSNLFNWNWANEAGRQLIFIGLSNILIFIFLLSDPRIYEFLAIPVYGIAIILLICVLFFGAEVGGSKSWLDIASFRFQPSELAKLGTILIVAKLLSKRNVNLSVWKDRWIPFGAILLPILLIGLQPDAGSAIVFLGLTFVLNREGLPSYFIQLGIGSLILSIFALAFKTNTVFIIILFFYIIALFIQRIQNRITLKDLIRHRISFLMIIAIIWSRFVKFFFNELLLPHQQIRIKLLLGQLEDTSAIGYQTTQSLIAIGSGGIIGKGYMKGTQTKFNFVPEQATDYIFCTVGEEWGFLGSSIVLICFSLLIGRIIILSNLQKNSFARIFGFGLASLLFMHFAINIGMTLGLMPVIGIPLPFFSYGGTSIMAFTAMLFIFLRMDSYRWETL
jgi:rod shape determining protein RodA